MLQNATFDTVLNTMGVECTWDSADGGASFVGRVLFNNPTEALRLQGFEFDPTASQMEFRAGTFTGLKERVDKRATTEFVYINASRFAVMAITAHHDGATFRASLQPNEP